VFAAVAIAGVTSPASADEIEIPPGWTRSPSQPFDAPAGTLCPFALHGDVVKDEVITKVIATYPDGSPKAQLFVGDLVFRFTNVDTGTAVTRDLGGDGLAEYGANKSSLTWTFIGPAAVTIPPSGAFAPGVYVLSGLHVLRYNSDGTFQMLVDEGRDENLCQTLAKE
jgi:hypothetical protein